MQNLKVFLISICLLPMIRLSAQTTSSGRKLQICDVNILIGGSSFIEERPTFNQFAKLFPGSSLLPALPAGYQSSMYGGAASVPYFSILLEMKSPKAKTAIFRNSRIRAGLAYSSGYGPSFSSYKEDEVITEPYTGWNSGRVIFMDSIHQEFYSADYSFKQIRLDGSFLIGTNREKRWSLYTGLGINFGMSFDTHTEVRHSSYDRKILIDDQGKEYSSFMNGSYHDPETENFKNKSNIGLAAYIPAGIDFRIGKNIKLLKHIHVFSEARPTVNLTYIPEIGGFTAFGYSVAIGLRIEMR